MWTRIKAKIRVQLEVEASRKVRINLEIVYHHTWEYLATRVEFHQELMEHGRDFSIKE